MKDFKQRNNLIKTYLRKTNLNLKRIEFDRYKGIGWREQFEISSNSEGGLLRVVMVGLERKDNFRDRYIGCRNVVAEVELKMGPEYLSWVHAWMALPFTE